MESWRDELYHYGVKGMKWRRQTDSGIDENTAAMRITRRHSLKDAATASRNRYEAQKNMRQGGDRDVLRNNKLMANRFSKVARLERKHSEEYDDKRRGRTKNRKNEGRGIRSKGYTYIRRVLS